MTTGELDEIFTHIMQLKQQRTGTHDTTASKDKKTIMFAGDKDIFHESRSKGTPISSSKNEISSNAKQESLASTSKGIALKKDDVASLLTDSHQLTPRSQHTSMGKKHTDAAASTFTRSRIDQTVSGSQRWDDTSMVTCDICSTAMILGRNLSGLVVDDHFFACEACCKSISKTELLDWTKSRMQQHPGRVRSIGIWVNEHINKNR